MITLPNGFEIDESDCDFEIDDEFANIMPATSEEEDNELDALILKHRGAFDPLLVWEEENILIDGHRRLSKCQEHQLPYDVRFRSYGDRQEALDDCWKIQYSRRNVPQHQKDLRLGKAIKGWTEVDGMLRNEAVAKGAALAECSVRTAWRSVRYSEKYEKMTPGWQGLFDDRSFYIPKRYIMDIGSCSPEEQERLLEAVLTSGDLSPLTEVFKKSTHQVKTENKRKHEKMLRDQEKPPVSLPEHIPTALLPEHASNRDTSVASRDEIEAMIVDIERVGGHWNRQLARLFTHHGLGNETKRSVWKREIDSGYRKILHILESIRQSF